MCFTIEAYKNINKKSDSLLNLYWKTEQNTPVETILNKCGGYIQNVL